MTKDASQEILKNLKAGGNISIGDVHVGDQYPSYGSREITVSGVGGTPPSFERYWVDRTSYQTLLTHRILTMSVTEIVAEGGFGKSSLAAWAFENLKGDFKKRLWIDFRVPPTFREVVRWILQEIGIRYDVQKALPEILLQELLYRLNDPNTPVKTLVILDQLESLADSSDRPWFEQFLSQWAEHGKESRVLVTTRSQFLPQGPIALTGMDVGEGSAFLTREGLTGDRFSDLITLAKGHPLLLKLAASWTKETYDSRVDDRAIDFFTKLFKNYTGDPKAGVSAIFSVIFEALPLALQKLLCRVSVYRLPIDGAMAEAMEGTIENLGILAGQGLLLLQGVDYVLHPLVAGFVRSRVTDEVRRDGHERAIGFYEANYQGWDGTIESCRSELEGFYHAIENNNYSTAYLTYCCISRFLQHYSFNIERQHLMVIFTERWHIQHENEISMGACLCELGHSSYSLGEYERAIDAYQKCLNIMRKIKYVKGKGYALSGLGNCYESLGEYEKAIDCHEESRLIAHDSGDLEGEVVALNSLANDYQSIGNYLYALQIQQEALSICQGNNFLASEAVVFGNLGNTYTFLGDHLKALECHIRHYDIGCKIDRCQDKSVALLNMSESYSHLGKYQQAMDSVSQSLNFNLSLKDIRGEALCYYSISKIYSQLGCIRLSRLSRNKSYEIWNNLNILLIDLPVSNQIKKRFLKSKNTKFTSTIIISENKFSTLKDVIGYLLFALRLLLSPLTQLQTRLKIQPKIFWFCVGIAIVLLIAWLRK